MGKENRFVAAALAVALGVAGCNSNPNPSGDKNPNTLTSTLTSFGIKPASVILTETSTLNSTPTLDLVRARTEIAQTETALIAEPTPTSTSTETPESTKLSPNKKFEILGKGQVVVNSVWPGGIETDPKGFPEKEAKTVAEIYNGATTKTSNQGNLNKLGAARRYAETIFGVTGKIDTTTLTLKQGGDKKVNIGDISLERTSDDYFEAQIGNGKVLILKVETPPNFTYNQIAVEDKNTGRAFTVNDSVLNNEKIYVVKVIDSNEQVTNILTIRAACGNIGSILESLPQPTNGPTPPQQPTPTPVYGSTPDKTPIQTPTKRSTIVRITPATPNPSSTAQNPEPTLPPRPIDQGTPTQAATAVNTPAQKLADTLTPLPKQTSTPFGN